MHIAQLSKDLTLKNNEIVQSEVYCGGLTLQVAELSEMVRLTELELTECKKECSNQSCSSNVIVVHGMCWAQRYDFSCIVL